MTNSQLRVEKLTARHFAHSDGCCLHIERAVAVIEILKNDDVGVVGIGVEERNGARVTSWTRRWVGTLGPDFLLQLSHFPAFGTYSLRNHHGRHVYTLGDYKSALRDGADLSIYTIVPARNEQSAYLRLLSRCRSQP